MRKETSQKIIFSLISFVISIFFQLINFILPTNLLVFNEKMLFGFAGNNTLAIILLSISIIALFFLSRKIILLSKVVWTLLLAGLISNLAERILRGGVLDYIRIGEFPSFNLADIAIVSSILFFLLAVIRRQMN